VFSHVMLHVFGVLQLRSFGVFSQVIPDRGR